MAPRRTRRPKSGKQLKIRPRQGSSSSPSGQQLYVARILTWIITIVLGTGVVLLFTNNPWGAAILTALGLVGQPIFDRFLKHFERWVQRHFAIVKAALPVVGLITVFVILFDIFSLAGWVQVEFPWQHRIPPTKNTPVASLSPTATRPPSLSPTATNYISISTRNSSLVGISDGRYAFDTGLSDAAVKKQAGEAIGLQHNGDAQAVLKEALKVDPTDAEALIYGEDTRVRTTTSSYTTLIVITTFKARDSKDKHATGASRDILQGASLAQITHNNANPSKPIMLLIANVPDPQIDSTAVATQIIQAAKQDPTIVGVIGWPSGSNDAIEALGKAHIPIVSPTSLNISSGAGGYFFSVAPSIDDQTRAAITYAKSQWKVNKAAVFYDPDDPHSSDLDTAFITNFNEAGGAVISNEAYSTDSPGELIQSASSLIAAYPDLKFFYFAGYPADARQLLQNIHGIHTIAGDSFSQEVHCPVSVCPVGSLSDLYFTASAFQDEAVSLAPDQQSLDQQTWLQLKSQDFITRYQQRFDTGNTYNSGELIGSDVMLAYDATSAFLHARLHVNGQPSTQAIQRALKSMQHVYGVSGHISFSSNGNPQQKAVLMLWPAATGIKLQSVPTGYY